MDNRLNGSLQYFNKSEIHTTVICGMDMVYVPPIVNVERIYMIFIPTRTDWDNLPHHATIPGSLGQIKTRKQPNLSYNATGKTFPLS